MARQSHYVFLVSLLSFAFLVACGSSQAEIDATLTQMDSDIFSTQTVQVPTPIKTCNGPQKLDNISGFLRGKPPVVGIAARQLQTRLGLGIPKMNEYALSYKHRR